MLRRHFINVSYSKDIKPNEIWYRTSNGMMYDIQAATDQLSLALSVSQSFTLLSNTYREDNWWCLTFLESVIHTGVDDEVMCLYPHFCGMSDKGGTTNSNVLYVTDVKLPNVLSIGYGAFSFCSSLTSITIPNSVTSIGGNAFVECSSLTLITFEGTIEQWNNITKGEEWNYNVPATVVHCTDGDVEI